MRGYYKALKELDQEHREIFGHSISGYGRKKERRRGEENSNYGRRAGYKKDEWTALRFESPDQTYKREYKQSDWSVIDGFAKKIPKEPDHEHYRARTKSSRHRGNGKINAGHKIKSAMKHIQRREYLRQKRWDAKREKIEKEQGMDSIERAKAEGERVREVREEGRIIVEEQQEKRKRDMDVAEKRRAKRYKLVRKKNHKGQPNMGAQMKLLVDRLQKKQPHDTHPRDSTQSKQRSRRGNRSRGYRGGDNTGNSQPTTQYSDDSRVHAFLADSD